MKNIFFSIFILSLVSGFGQNGPLTNSCFESGNFTGWNLYVGDVTSNQYEVINQIQVSVPNNQHQIVLSGNDSLVGTLPRVFPGGGTYSVMLGDGIGTGGKAAILRQTFGVDPTSAFLDLHYAFVLDHPFDHVLGEDPFFIIKFYDINGNPITIFEDSVSMSTLQPVDGDSLIYFLPWTTKHVNLLNYIGQNVTVEFIVGDCAQGDHFSYAYVDMDCPDLCDVFGFTFDHYTQVLCSDSGYVSSYVYGSNHFPSYNYLWSTGDTTPDIYPTTPGIYSLTVTANDSLACSETRSIVVAAPIDSSGFDLETNCLSRSVFRPGLYATMGLSVLNNDCDTVTGQLKINLDDRVTYTFSYPSPSIINGDTLIWDIPALSWDSIRFSPLIYFIIDSTVIVGDQLCFDLEVTPIVGDIDITNNSKNYCFNVVNSYDPNYIEVYSRGECSENYVLSNQELVYTVHFQNTGTAPAIDIYVLDTLNAGLDINTVRVIGQSHEGLITEVENGNVLNFKFDNINLPDSASNETESHGYVIYKVKPINAIPNDTRVENRVGIYFDFNEAIITNTVFNTFVDSIPNKETILTETAVTSYDLNGITYDSTGTYYQYLFSAKGCDSTIVLNLTITTTGVNVLNTLNDVMVYPNPIHNELKVSFPNTFVNYQVEVISITGQPIFKGNNTSKINTSSFAQGIYFVKVWNDKQVQIKKVVKE